MNYNRKNTTDTKCLLSELEKAQTVDYTVVVNYVELFPKAVMKQTKVIDGECEGSGN